MLNNVSSCSRKSPRRTEFYEHCSVKTSKGDCKSRQLLTYFKKVLADAGMVCATQVCCQFSAFINVYISCNILKCFLSRFAASHECLK